MKQTYMNILAVVLSLAISQIGLCLGFHEKFGQNDRRLLPDAWEPKTVEGVPCKIALNLEHSRLDRRDMFLLLEDRYFKPESLKKLFQGLSSEYTSPAEFKVIAYSDATMLRKEIDGYGSSICLFTDGSPASNEAARRFAEDHSLYPAKIGYFRAYYFRSDDEEEFRYTLNADSETYIKMTIRSKEVEPETYTGVVDTDLLLAARKGDLAKVESVLALGANINSRDKNHRTSLHRAIIWGHLDIANLLIAKGADVNAKDKRGDTALMFAADEDVTLIRYLLAAGADVNAQDNLGDTAVMTAVLSEHAESLRALVAAGAKVNQSDVDGQTPLMFAANSPELLNILISNGADVNAKDNEGYTALMAAAKGGNSDCVKALLAAGANLSMKSKKGLTALDIAGEENHIHIVKLLSKIQQK